MKKLLLATSVIALSMGPAFAQSSDSSSDMSNSDSTSMSSSDSSSMSSSDSSGNSSMSTEDMVASQSKVLDALKQAGYTDAEIMDAAYMVQAKTPDGEQVLMMIDTSGRVMGAQRASGNGGSSSSGSMDSSSGSGSMDSSTGSSSMGSGSMDSSTTTNGTTSTDGSTGTSN
ncbi:hypothetical protein [Fulvimarina sp. MAC3]|uniref:hypothetical protein n=1 Tax=Fulvimarina sp. MAC3 TaxID=3148887 RepID=UPI0031FC81A2